MRGPAQCRRGDARGLEVSPGSLLKDELVQRQIRDRFAQPAILELKLLQPFYLFDLQAAKFLAPAGGFDIARKRQVEPIDMPMNKVKLVGSRRHCVDQPRGRDRWIDRRFRKT